MTNTQQIIVDNSCFGHSWFDFNLKTAIEKYGPNVILVSENPQNNLYMKKILDGEPSDSCAFYNTIERILKTEPHEFTIHGSCEGRWWDKTESYKQKVIKMASLIEETKSFSHYPDHVIVVRNGIDLVSTYWQSIK